ncbi:MAG: hypothetical protein NVSMB21_13500 [Vulcanimicrobiaceae bacterium]
MERTDDGGKTWAMWRTAVLGLAPDALRRYLCEVEHLSPEKAATFESDVGATDASEWAPSGEAAAALDRFFTWKHGAIDARDDLKRQQVEGAALPPDEARGPAR